MARMRQAAAASAGSLAVDPARPVPDVPSQPALVPAPPLASRPDAAAPMPAPQPHHDEAAPVRLALPELEAAVADEYRSLRARIQSLRRQRGFRSLVISSARAGEGRTTTALRLAQSYGLERDFDTCLIDLDLRNPALHRCVRGDTRAGASDVLEGRSALADAVLPVLDSRLHAIPAGRRPDDPSELLESVRMARMVDELHRRFELVLVDSPPILGLPDGTELVDQFDAVLLVVAAGGTTARDLYDALDRIDGNKLVGTVLNRCERPVTPALREHDASGDRPARL